MPNLHKTLNALQPYVIGIRYVDNITVVDTIFKSGWTLPDLPNIKKAKGNDEALNYYMIYSDNEDIILDDLLEYVANVIKINIEREKKHDLLRTKVNELKEFFKKHSLTQLNNLKFILSEEDLVPELDDFDIDIPDTIQTDLVIEPTVTTKLVQPIQTSEPLTEEELEMVEEEARAENYRRIKESEKLNGSKILKNKAIELPPRKKIGEVIMSGTLMPDCDCGPNEACEKCIELKDL